MAKPSHRAYTVIKRELRGMDMFSSLTATAGRARPRSWRLREEWRHGPPRRRMEFTARHDRKPIVTKASHHDPTRPAPRC